MMNYREKNGKDPHPSERESKLAEFTQEADAIIKEYDLGDKINDLIE